MWNLDNKLTSNKKTAPNNDFNSGTEMKAATKK